MGGCVSGAYEEASAVTIGSMYSAAEGFGIIVGDDLRKKIQWDSIVTFA